MIPVWVDALLDKTCYGHPELAKKVKTIWNKLADDFLQLDFVRERDKWWNPLDAVDKLELALKIGNTISFEKISNAVRWFTRKGKGGGESYHQHAFEEQAFKDKKAFIVYGHTHHMEVVPLDTFTLTQALGGRCTRRQG